MQILQHLPAPFPPLPSESPHHQGPAAAASRRELTDANQDLQGALSVLAGCCDLTCDAQALGVEVRKAMAQVVRLAEALEALTR